MSKKTTSNFYKSVLHQNNPLNISNDIYNQFVVIPIDKATVDVAYICQRFYALVLIKELDLDLNNTGTNKTFVPEYRTSNLVITAHITF